MDTNIVYLITGANRGESYLPLFWQKKGLDPPSRQIICNVLTLYTPSPGIGFALVEDLIDRPNTTILACVRDPAPPAITALLSLSPPPGNHLHILPYDASVPWSPDVLLPLITAQHINHINVLIANAGTEFGFHSIAATSVSDIRDSLEINTLAPIALFQACWPLMERSTLPEKQQQGAKFVFVSSMLGSIGVEAEGAALAYGISKVAMNFFVRKVHFEYPACVSIALSPG